MTALLLALLPQAVELDYRPTVAAEEREKVVDILKKRLAAGGIDRAALAAQPDGLLRVTLPGAGPEDAARAKRLLAPRGLLELRPLADRETQEKFNKDGLVPEGWEAMANPRPRAMAEYAAWGETILVRKRSAIEGGRIVRAAAESQAFASGRDWFVAVQLDPVGAKAFDAAAAALFRQRPPGQIAIVLDGRVTGTPAVMTDRFGGMMRITGQGGEADVKALAIVLGQAPLPAALGEPEAERVR